MRNVAHFPAQSRNHVHGKHVALWDSWRRTVDSGFHFFNNKSDGTRPLNEHVMHFVGLCVLLLMFVGFRPLRTVLLLSLIMVFVNWNCYATVTDVSQMLWLSLGVPITEPRRAVQTGRVLACLAGTSSIQVKDNSWVSSHSLSFP